ncbi:hypothetical protein M9Y10_009365 [Tritrichomonas musculus]|uniref:Uncharacterized protein n=1 Tax=Tritrichomonas musculus TaxID=1915356 RepID=A0ABR2IP12_9EUKA
MSLENDTFSNCPKPLAEKIVVRTTHGCLKMPPTDLSKQVKRPKAHQSHRDFSWEIDGYTIRLSSPPSFSLPNKRKYKII